MKIIIVGAGEVGFHIAKKLSSENKDVVLVEINEERVRRVQQVLDVQAILGRGAVLPFSARRASSRRRS